MLKRILFTLLLSFLLLIVSCEQPTINTSSTHNEDETNVSEDNKDNTGNETGSDTGTTDPNTGGDTGTTNPDDGGNTTDPNTGGEDNPNVEPKEVILILDEEDLLLPMGNNYQLHLTKSDNAVYSYEYDTTIINIVDDNIIPLKEGSTVLKLIKDNEVIKSIKVDIYEIPTKLAFVNLPDKIYTNETLVIKVNNPNVDIEVISSGVVEFDKDTSTVTPLKAGIFSVTATFIYDNNIKTTSVVQVANLYTTAKDYVVDDAYSSSNNGDEIIIDSKLYTYGTNLFSSISEGLQKFSTLKIISTNETSLNLTKSNIELIGISDKLLDLKITVNSGLKNIRINNLNFTGSSKLTFSGNNTNITISNNKFVNTTVNSTSWAATNSYTSGLIEFNNSDEYHDNIVIENNVFDNIGDCGINISTTHELLCKNNTFDIFKKDGIRLNNGPIKKACHWKFIGNSFRNSPYSGLYFRTYSSSAMINYCHYVDIKDNYFSSLGSTSVEYSSAITFRNYQEGVACVNIAYNTFNACDKFIFLRNNAVAANQPNFTGYVVGNKFETVPSKYYINNVNSSDTTSTNPTQTKLLDNLFLDGSGNELTPTASKFIGALTNTTISKDNYASLVKVDLPRVLFLEEQVTISHTLTNLNSEYLSFTNNKLKALKDGTTILKADGYDYEIKIIKTLELVVKFINIALGEKGYKEMNADGTVGSGNYTKYGQWYGINPGAWCAMFVSWCANQAGVSTSIIPKYASVQIGMDWYKNKGLFQYKENYTPKAGDLMFMKSAGASHTGIVLYCDGTTLYTIEGNTSDCCALRKYNVNYEKITGYGTPQWPYYSPEGYDFSSGEASDGHGHKTT